mmetsp:Transcript_37921/g.70065  ORF Transcript_37921/g.70065 Transcript_37921/m.70065 type:complete len:236 (+) Transcript_37921:387-1094(+)
MLRYVYPTLSLQLVPRSLHPPRRNHRNVPPQHRPPRPPGQNGAGGDHPPQRTQTPLVQPSDHEQVAQKILHLPRQVLRQAPQSPHARAGRPRTLQNRNLPKFQGEHHLGHHLPRQRGARGGDHRQDAGQVHRRTIRKHGNGIPRLVHERPRTAPPRRHPRLLRTQAGGLDHQGFHAGLPHQGRKGVGGGKDESRGVFESGDGAEDSEGGGGRDFAKGADEFVGEGGERVQRVAGE